ncbi:Serine/threonine-protein kinase PLK2 [Acipenser ruthenus]|uniref:Serine/threonine-protein kinase PLK2 n=1 Tax=Acipenser ruthenus TaxID=7906 RepID=A0A444URD1_ACIRT|nr:Serine/threonine-protein kinase PLK2 [Acipenser ruthenus]
MFILQGFTPERLSSSCCHSAPDFHLSSPAKNFFKKAAAALFGGKKEKAKYYDNLNKLTKEEDEIHKLRHELKKSSISHQPHKHKSHEDTIPPVAPVGKQTALMKENKQQIRDTIRMIVRGTLGSCSSSSECLEDSTMGSVADTVTRVLRGCLENMPEADTIPNEHLNSTFQWVTKWVDYSNKYGFGYQLSDHTVGVLFNNGTHMSLLSDKNVTDTRKPRLYLLQWLKSDRALMMLFNDGTFQVNFYHDHTKIIICNQKDEYLLTYINEDRVSTTFHLTTLLMSGCSPDLRSRMEYALNMLLQRCN